MRRWGVHRRPLHRKNDLDWNCSRAPSPWRKRAKCLAARRYLAAPSQWILQRENDRLRRNYTWRNKCQLQRKKTGRYLQLLYTLDIWNISWSAVQECILVYCMLLVVLKQDGIIITSLFQVKQCYQVAIIYVCFCHRPLLAKSSLIQSGLNVSRCVFVSTQSVVQRLASLVSIEYHLNLCMLTSELTGLTHTTLSAVALTCHVKDALPSGRLMVQDLKNRRQNGKQAICHVSSLMCARFILYFMFCYCNMVSWVTCVSVWTDRRLVVIESVGRAHHHRRLPVAGTDHVLVLRPLKVLKAHLMYRRLCM